MSETPELTPREKVHLNLYKDPEVLFRRALFRALNFIIPSVALMIAALITKDIAYAIMGYGLLLYQSVLHVVLARRGVRTTSSIVTKYESRVQDKKNDG